MVFGQREDEDRRPRKTTSAGGEALWSVISGAVIRHICVEAALKLALGGRGIGGTESTKRYGGESPRVQQTDRRDLSDGPSRRERSVAAGWKLGAEDFRDRMADKLARRGSKGEKASERPETDAAMAERMACEALKRVRWRGGGFGAAGERTFGEGGNRAPATRGNAHDSRLIATRLGMGSASYVLISSVVSRVSSDPFASPLIHSRRPRERGRRRSHFPML